MLMHYYSVALTCVVFGLLGVTMALLAAFSPFFTRALAVKLTGGRLTGGNAFAALPDRDDDLDEVHDDGTTTDSEMRPTRRVRSESSLDLDIDEDDLALFNAVHPGITGGGKPGAADDAGL